MHIFSGYRYFMFKRTITALTFAPSISISREELTCRYHSAFQRASLSESITFFFSYRSVNWGIVNSIMNGMVSGTVTSVEGACRVTFTINVSVVGWPLKRPSMCWKPDFSLKSKELWYIVESDWQLVLHRVIFTLPRQSLRCLRLLYLHSEYLNYIRMERCAATNTTNYS